MAVRTLDGTSARQGASEKAHLDVFTGEAAFYESAYCNFPLGLPPVMASSTDEAIRQGLQARSSFGLTNNSTTDTLKSPNSASNGANSMLRKPRRRRTAFTQVGLTLKIGYFTNWNCSISVTTQLLGEAIP